MLPFLPAVSEGIDVSPYTATNYPWRGKQLLADSWVWRDPAPLEESVNPTAPCAQVPVHIFEKHCSAAILTVFHLLSRSVAANSITDGFHTWAMCLFVARACEHADDLEPRYSISIFLFFFSPHLVGKEYQIDVPKPAASKQALIALKTPVLLTRVPLTGWALLHSPDNRFHSETSCSMRGAVSCHESH